MDRARLERLGWAGSGLGVVCAVGFAITADRSAALPWSLFAGALLYLAGGLTVTWCVGRRKSPPQRLVLRALRLVFAAAVIVAFLRMPTMDPGLPQGQARPPVAEKDLSER